LRIGEPISYFFPLCQIFWYYGTAMKISVYIGEGALPFPLAAERVAKEDILVGGLSGCTHFIMPGGRDRPYDAALRGTGCRLIRRFVENGGTYIGICAGGYFGAKRVAFDVGFPLEVSEERELAFFPGTAIGPAYGKGTFDYESQRGARAALLELEIGSFYAYYNGGCAFEGDFSGVRILARYADLPGKPPAILECPIGKGKAILSGVHLETDPEALSANDPYLPEIVQRLRSTNEERLRFWGSLTHLA